MKDSLPIRGVKLLALAIYYANLWSIRIMLRAKGEKPFRLGGNCEKCAKCCEQPGIQVIPLIWHWGPAKKVFLWYQRRVNGFILEDRIPHQRVFLFRCSHFDWETRRCDSYSSRPGMCRDYPRQQMWQSVPQLLQGCGYRPIHPNAARLREQLREEGLEGEALHNAEEKLFLKE